MTGAKPPVVSVVLPYFNAAGTLREAARSVLAQQEIPLELLLVDDGSSDDSAAVAADFADDPRVRLLGHPNRGLAATLNVGIEASRAPLIARMDADDVCVAGRFAAQVRYFDDHPETVLLGGQIDRLIDRRVRSRSAFPTDNDAIVDGLLQGRHMLSHPTVAFRRSIALSAGGYWSEGLAEDWDLYLRLSEHGRLANLAEVVLEYRYHATGINADSMREVRMGIALAVANHRRRAAGLEEFSASSFEHSISLRDRIRIAAETRSLTHYRAALATSGPRGRLHLAAAAAAWPPFAWHRILGSAR